MQIFFSQIKPSIIKRIVDDLRQRERPGDRNNLLLSEVLRRSEAFERGDGLLPVKIPDFF